MPLFWQATGQFASSSDLSWCQGRGKFGNQSHLVLFLGVSQAHSEDGDGGLSGEFLPVASVLGPQSSRSTQLLGTV